SLLAMAVNDGGAHPELARYLADREEGSGSVAESSPGCGGFTVAPSREAPALPHPRREHSDHLFRSSLLHTNPLQPGAAATAFYRSEHRRAARKPRRAEAPRAGPRLWRTRRRRENLGSVDSGQPLIEVRSGARRGRRIRRGLRGLAR